MIKDRIINNTVYKFDGKTVNKSCVDHGRVFISFTDGTHYLTGDYLDDIMELYQTEIVDKEDWPLTEIGVLTIEEAAQLWLEDLQNYDQKIEEAQRSMYEVLKRRFEDE